MEGKKYGHYELRHGPYERNGYKFYCYKDETGANRSVYEHTVVMANCIGRWLRKDEIVHHRNGNRADNSLTNLELMSRSEHARHHRPESLMERRRCPSCKKYFEILTRIVRRNQKVRECAGPFCSKRCSGMYSRTKQLLEGSGPPRKKKMTEHGTETTYRYGCRCHKCKKAHATTATAYRMKKRSGAAIGNQRGPKGRASSNVVVEHNKSRT